MSQHSLHIDFETYSEADIRDVGAYRYAFDPSTEILCAAMALGDESPAAWWQGMRAPLVDALDPYWEALENPEVLIWAHNAGFEMAIMQALLEKTWNIKCPDLSRFRCTMSLARRAALPSKLEKLAEVLELKHQKDRRGASLIRKFSMMQKGRRVSKKWPQGSGPYRILPSDEPDLFLQFVEYCRQDIRAEREVCHRLAYFDNCPLNTANYSLDAVINARGVPVNVAALKHAQLLIDEETEIVSQKFRRLTGIEITQNARLLKWINDGPLFKFDNLQAETLDAFLETYENHSIVPKEVEALRMKQSIAYASIKKVSAMLKCAGPKDNRVRGMLSYHGASTGRWSHTLIQLGNVRRSTMEESGEAYRDICDGISRELLELTYGPVMEVIANTMRHYIHDCDGETENPFLNADYSSVESRIVCWLAGQEDALEEYRQDVDRYKRMAAFIYRVPEERVDEHPQRFVGKQCILGCGYQMGPSKFRMTCKKMGNYNLPPGMEDIAVKAFRQKHPELVNYWYEMDRTAKKAILYKNKIFPCGKLSFLHKDVEGMPFLLLRLPSGRKLAYPKPRVVPSRKFPDSTSIVFFGHILGARWGDVDTFGAKLLENATQAVAADLMLNGAHRSENHGYQIATTIHDEVVCYHGKGQTVGELVKHLTTLPEWAEGLPLAAKGKVIPFYKK